MNQVTEEVDVLVVGYGPVGATIACLLGEYGVKTLVVDKATEILLAPRAIALDNEALRILQMAGLDEQSFERIAIPYVRMLSPYVGEFGRINTCGAIDGHPKLVTFYQPDLERALRSRVAGHSSIRTLLGVELQSFVDDASGVRAQIRRADGSSITVAAKYLVGADGASSSVRRAIGQDFEGQTYPEDWLIVDAQNVPTPIDHVEFICDPRRPTPHMVAPGKRERWEFMLQRGERREDMESLDAIRKLLSRWGTPEQMHIERKAVYRFHARCCDAFSKGRVFLAGDAAHITPPFVGQGLVAGLRDAANLCWKLAAVTAGRATPSILVTYDEERRPHAHAMIGLAKLMGHLVMPGNALLAMLNHGVMRVLRLIPPLRRFFDELGVKPKNAFRRGLFLRARGPLTPGGLLPQGLVRNANGNTQLSDAVLGRGLTLVGFGVDPLSALSSEGAAAWANAGGNVAQICHRGQFLHRSPGAFEDMQGTLLSQGDRIGCIAVIRPDRVILHQGRIGDADRLVGDALALMGPGGSAAESQPVSVAA